MAYKIELGGRKIYLAGKAETALGDYIVYEWNDGIFIDDDDDDWDDDDDSEYESLEDELDEEEILFDDDEDEVEESVRLDIEEILKNGFVPEGGVSTHMTDEYTTIYSQAFYRRK